MKAQNNYGVVFMGILIYMIFAGCTKKTQWSDSPSGTLIFHIHVNLDSIDIGVYNTVYSAKGHRKISLNLTQLYISNIQLIRLDGTIYNVSGTTLLQILENEVYKIGDVPAGNYKSVRFRVGLDSIADKKVPVDPEDSLFNTSTMWFGTSAQPQGYIFLNLQGKIDTTTKADGTEEQMQTFVYKLGTQANYRQITMPDQNFTVIPTRTQFVHLRADYMELFKGVQLNNKKNLNILSAADNTKDVAKIISNNIPLMFKYEME